MQGTRAFNSGNKVLKTMINLNYVKDSVIPEQQINHVLLIKTNHFILCREIITVCTDVDTKHIPALCGENINLSNVRSGSA